MSRLLFRARRRLVAAVAVAGACALGPLAGAGTAHAASGQVSAFVECVWTNTNGTKTIAYGYTNPLVLPVTIPVGNDNRFTSQPDNQGQPTVFKPGTVHNAFIVTTSATTLTWHMPGGNAVANPSATKCAQAPVPVFASLPIVLLGLAILLPVTVRLFGRSRRFRRAWAGPPDEGEQV